MKRRALFLALLASSTAAGAGEVPVVGPAPAWVTAVEAPPPPKPVEGAPLTLLLSDSQLRFEPGAVVAYSRTLLRIDTAQGLAAGAISLPWRPDVGDLGIHVLRIHRGDRVIDALAAGKPFSVARREPNLENATLDGVLTANIQPEGLEVGDVLEIATSVSTRDPVLGRHVEELVGLGAPLPVARAHVRVSWPATLPMRLRVSGALAPIKPVRVGQDLVAEVTLGDVAPTVPPKFAPPRYRIGRLIEFSDYADWAAPGAQMAPLFARAATLPASGPLADEVARIAAASADPAARATAALALVQDRVRYVALAMGSGGLVPADAAATWSRRYGDCKAKTALLLAMLHALGIAAQPVAVNATAGDAIDQRLPGIGVFNHVLVRATIANRTYWLDGTRTGDTALDRIATPNFGWGLPLVAEKASLVRMVPPPLAVPTSEVAVAIDASAGLTIPAPVELTSVLRGDEAVATNAALSNLTPAAREQALRAMWKQQYDFIDVATTAARFDAATAELRMTATGKARMDWKSGWYETDGLGLGWRADFARDPKSDAPYMVAYPRYVKASETIKLPAGFPRSSPVAKGAIDRTIGGVAYRRTAAIEERVFRAEASERALAPEFSAADAVAAEAALREMAASTVYIRRPDRYAPTEAEVALSMASTPGSTEERLARGYALMNRARFDDAIKDFDAVLAAEPKNGNALANRGMARVWKGDYAAATSDLDAAAAVEPRHAVVFRARALAAIRQGKLAESIPLWDRAVELDPRNAFARQHRARTKLMLGDFAGALSDADAALAVEPGDVDARMLRFAALRGQGKLNEALPELKTAVDAAPDQSALLTYAAGAYLRAGKTDEGMRLYDRALTLDPSPTVYASRALHRAREDTAGRMADLDAALKLAPNDADVLALRAAMLIDRGERDRAATLFDQAVAAYPTDGALSLRRGVVRARLGQEKEAAADFARASAWARGSADRLNSLCWEKATAGVALTSALADCDAALAIEPNGAAYLDSKALVLLRMGRTDEAVAAYDRALAMAPGQAASLFGRSVAYAKAGDKSRSDADLAAARALSDEVEPQFAEMGITR